MARKRKPTVDDAYDNKQRAATTLAEQTIIDNAQQATKMLVGFMDGAFDNWILIGRAVVLAREIADREGGGKTFMRLLENWQLAPVVNKSTASTLERIMKCLPEVLAWRETLTTRQRIDWAAPTTILKHCPTFKKPPPAEGEEKPLTKGEQTSQALAVALEEIEELKQREDGDRFKATDTAQDIAIALVGMFSPRKAKDIFERGLELLKKREPKKPRLKNDQEDATQITG